MPDFLEENLISDFIFLYFRKSILSHILFAELCTFVHYFQLSKQTENMSEEFASENEYDFADTDDEGNGGSANRNVNFSVDDLYRREAEVTTNLLMETVEQLYASPPVITNAAIDNDEPVDEFVRPPTYGYAAHVDKVSTSEVRNWQRSFDYLAVVGTAIQIPDLRFYSCESELVAASDNLADGEPQ